MRRALLFLTAFAGCGVRLGGGEPARPSDNPGAPCTTSADCPAPAGPCFAAACASGTCRDEVVAAGVVPTEQVKGDCREMVCDGRGGLVPRDDPGDAPEDDANECTEERCAGGRPEHAPVVAGAACGRGGVCNGGGVCGECVPGRGRCSAAEVPGRCDAMGRWHDAPACGDDGPICADGACGRAVALALGEGAICARVESGATRCLGPAAACAALEGPSGCWERASPPPPRVPDALSERPARPRAGKVPAVEPRRAPPPPRPAEVAGDEAFACARLPDGSVWCWGAARLPARIAPLPKAVGLAVGRAHACALGDDGRVLCWGDNGKGQLGDGTTRTRRAPAPARLAKAQAIAARGDRTCAVERGRPVCWGEGATAPSAPRW